jgi:hypothetical protein
MGTVQILQYRTPNTIVVTPYFTSFKGLNVIDAATDYFDFTWTLGDI